MILGRLWMKKNGVLLDMINDSITFSPEYYTHPGAPSFLILTMLSVNTKIISMATQKDVLPNRILKKGLAEKIDKFLKISEELSKKKRRLINASKRKTSMAKSNHKTVVISILDNSKKKGLPISIPETKVSTLDIKEVKITIIGMDAYRTAYKLKRAQVLAISMRNLEYQVEKEARPETNPKTIVPEEYHDLLDVFSKKDSDTLPPHQKYYHKIILKEEQKHGHAPLYKMSPQELDAVKRRI